MQFHFPSPRASLVLPRSARPTSSFGARIALVACLFACTSLGTQANTGAQDLPSGEAPQVIDQYLEAELSKHEMQPAALASDAVLLRRTSLDLIGRPPSPREIRQYLTDDEPGKRQRMVERLMASAEYVEHQTEAYNDLLMGQNKVSLKAYLQPAFAENRPWDAIFQQLVLSEDAAAAPFLKARVKDLDKLTNEVSVAFFGLNISCAKCHSHPFVTEWTQDHFYGMKSFFSRTFEHGDRVGEQDYGTVSFKTPAGESKTARLMFFTGTDVKEPDAKEPDAKAKKAFKAKLDELKKKKLPAPAPSFSRRAALVEVALEADNQRFLARAIVNQLWKRHFGMGLIDPVDQMHPENPSVHPELLEWLATDFIHHQFDLQHLTRSLVLSDAYARSSRWTDDNRPSDQLFAVAQVRPLTPRQYAMTLRMGATSPTYFDVDDSEHTKRIQSLRNSANGMARFFDPVVGDFQISVTEALWMSNSQEMADRLMKVSNDSLIAHLSTIDSPDKQAEVACQQVLGRPGESAVLEAITKHLSVAKDSDPKETAGRLQEAVWSLLSSSGCRFNY